MKREWGFKSLSDFSRTTEIVNLSAWNPGVRLNFAYMVLLSLMIARQEKKRKVLESIMTSKLKPRIFFLKQMT